MGVWLCGIRSTLPLASILTSACLRELLSLHFCEAETHGDVLDIKKFMVEQSHRLEAIIQDGAFGWMSSHTLGALCTLLVLYCTHVASAS